MNYGRLLAMFTSVLGRWNDKMFAISLEGVKGVLFCLALTVDTSDQLPLVQKAWRDDDHTHLSWGWKIGLSMWYDPGHLYGSTMHFDDIGHLHWGRFVSVSRGCSVQIEWAFDCLQVNQFRHHSCSIWICSSSGGLWECCCNSQSVVSSWQHGMDYHIKPVKATMQCMRYEM